MEKYSAWRDAETAIHPFFHPKPKEDAFILRPLLDFALFVPKIFLIIPFFTLYFLIASITNIMPIAVIRRLAQRLVHGVGCRGLLFLLGFYWIPSSYQKLTRQHQLPKIYPPGVNIASGDLIICNKVSYFEILYLGFRFSPLFTAVTIDGEHLKPIGLFTALFDALRLRKTYQKDKTCKSLQSILVDAENNKRGPVVVFPEGTSGNGRGLLAKCGVIKGVDPQRHQYRTHIIGFRFEWATFCPTYSVGSPLYHLYRICGQVYNTMTVRYLSPNDVPVASSDDWDELLFGALANLLRLKRTKLTVNDHQEFLAFWEETNKKGYVKKKK